MRVFPLYRTTIKDRVHRIFLQMTAKDIEDGDYKKLYALQGQGNTYWTGAVFRAEDGSLLWKVSEEILLPQLLASL